MSKEWNWYGEDEKSSVIVKAVQAVAVYSNNCGEIVIRQQDALGGEDGVIVFPKRYAEAIAQAIMTEVEAAE
jgi:hypothetical protein